MRRRDMLRRLPALGGGVPLPPVEHCERQMLARVRVLNLVDAAHAAFADETQGPVPATDSRWEVRSWHWGTIPIVRHRGDGGRERSTREGRVVPSDLNHRQFLLVAGVDATPPSAGCA